MSGLPTVFPAMAPGRTLALVAPAGPVEAERLPRAVALVEAAGYRARVFPGALGRDPERPWLAGSDAVRLADLHAALAAPDVAALWCLRGGYGAMRLLPRLDAALVRRARRPLVGYSDISALLALWAREGVPALHAPMAASDLALDGREGDRAAIFDTLRHGLAPGAVLAPPLAPAAGMPRVAGVAEGVLVGGNLSIVCALLGTPWAGDFRRAIVFLEDVNEEPYRLDRLLVQLQLAGVLDAAAGFVLGSFTRIESPGGVLAGALGALGKPVLAGWPAGHGTPNRPLPIGARVRLDAGRGTIELLEPAATIAA